MRLCFIADGSSIHVRRIVSYYLSRGDKILLLSTARRQSCLGGVKIVPLVPETTFTQSKTRRRQTRRRQIINIVKSFIPRAIKVAAKRMRRNARLLFKFGLCMKEIGEFEPDMIYCFRCFPEGMLALHCHSRPLVVRTAGPDISEVPKYPMYRQIIRKVLKTADIIITESLWERKVIRDLCGTRVNPAVSVIGIDTNTFRPPECQTSLRNKYGVPVDAFVIVSNRYLGGHYSGWSVVEAVESILDECPQLRLVYLSPSKMGLRTKARAESVSARYPQIRFIDGPVAYSEMPNILGCGDLYVTFSRADGVPNSLLEAMACGLVPIAADLPPLRDWIEDGKSGFLVPQARVDALASTLHKLYGDRRQLHVMSKRCISRVQEQGCYEKCSAQMRSSLLDYLSAKTQQREGFHATIEER